ncbi:MAG: DUF971 domain-containing protein [Rhodomicrobium sp.]|nr:DUF971 domain-containing protein [Rhodomicrobium sp.]
MSDTQNRWPTEIRLNPDKDTLFVEFVDGRAFSLRAEFLRVHSPSAEVQGHSPEERKILGGKRRVTIASIEPTGNYAIRLGFSDGHGTGIYTWAYLSELGEGHDALWADYLAELEKRGLKRD